MISEIYDIWHAATGLLGDLVLISQIHARDLPIMSARGAYTMEVKEAALSAALMRPRAVIPCHDDTFPIGAANIDQLRRRMVELTARTELLPMRPGDSIRFAR
jgi:L-ascorbate metabolism protein UlaG (beta-lactamase superfamily)